MRGIHWAPVVTEPDPEHVVVDSNGQVREHILAILHEDMVGQIKTGYRCINCFEAFPNDPWPETCSLCRFPIREKQTERYAKEYKGNIRVGPSTTIDEELAIAEELVARERMDKLGIKSTSSIIVPHMSPRLVI